MDYSVLLSKMTVSYFVGLAGVLIMPAVIIAAIFQFNKVKVQNAINPKNIKKINLILHLMVNALFAFMLIVYIMGIPPIFNDLPNVIMKNYIVDECLVIGQDSGGAADNMDSRGVGLRSLKTGEEFQFTTNYTPIRNGEYYRVMYWPNSKIGAIIEKIK